MFTGVIRGAIYHVKGIYTYAFKGCPPRMALGFHGWPSFISTQHTEEIPSLLLLPATLPDFRAGRAVKGKNFLQN